MVTSGLASGRVSIQVAAIETRSLPSSLAAARRGFTFYLADPSARLTSIAKAVRVNRPYQNLAVQVNRRYHFCNGARTAQTTRSQRRISPGGSARSISSPFAARNADQISCATKHTSKVLFDSARIYHDHRRWNLNLLLLMPDHFHALIGIDGRDSLSQVIRDYKRITAKLSGVEWQRNFFDHRLRHDESLTEKFAYICQNPVRAGLVQNEADWPYRFIPDSEFRR